MASSLNVIISLLRNIVEALKGGGGTDVILSELSTIKQALQKADVKSSFEGYKFADGYTSTSLLDFLQVFQNKELIEIYDDKATYIGDFTIKDLPSYTSIKKVTFTKVKDTFLKSNPNGDFFGSLLGVNIEEIIFPEVENLGLYLIYRYGEKLKKVYFPKVTNVLPMDTYSFNQSPNLIDVTVGLNATSTIQCLRRWNPVNAISNTSSSLIEDGEPFSNNREKFLYNLKNHIAALLPDRTGQSSLTIYFNDNVKLIINNDPETLNAFVSKNWTIA